MTTSSFLGLSCIFCSLAMMDYQAEDTHEDSKYYLYDQIYHNGDNSEAVSHYYCENVTHVSHEAVACGSSFEPQSSYLVE